MPTDLLPDAFHDLEPYIIDWAKSTRQERYDTRLSKNITELEQFYDAIAPHAEAAIDHLNTFELDQLPEPETRLLHLLYSLIMVSYPVNVFKQPRIPDSGAAFYNTVIEPNV